LQFTDNNVDIFRDGGTLGRGNGKFGGDAEFHDGWKRRHVNRERGTTSRSTSGSHVSGAKDFWVKEGRKMREFLSTEGLLSV